MDSIANSLGNIFLPAEIRTLIYEEIACTTRISSFESLRRNNSCSALLQTCRFIHQELEPIVFQCADIELPISNWNFEPVQTVVNQLQNRNNTAKALEQNDHFTVSISAERWVDDEDTHMERLQAWLKARLQDAAIDVKYKMWQPMDGPHWKSVSQFKWMTGLEELRQLQGRTKGAESREVGKIVRALEAEAENVAQGIEASGKSLDKQRRALAQNYRERCFNPLNSLRFARGGSGKKAKEKGEKKSRKKKT